MKTKRITEKQFRMLKHFRYAWPELVKLSRSLQTIGIKECNCGLTARDEKRRERLEKKAEGLAKCIGLDCYIQRDPRGCMLYLIGPSCREYTDGISVY
ncbi:MAG: hypothetical protein PHN44_08640 [Candidatus Marinimicrobia bacterium]|nr:hypothetical protein [Candidatus Neomarinimicrobiota bacterium]